MIEFLNMGGYAVFVWGSYFIALLLVSILYVRSIKALKSLQSKEQSASSKQEASGTVRAKSLA
jgi:heme exporter protein CcmD